MQISVFQSAARIMDGTETSDYWNRACMDDLPEKKHKKNLEQKMLLVEKARELRRDGYSLTMIQKELNICYSSLKRYLSEDYNPINGNYNTKHPSKIKPYADEIISMLQRGMPFKKIEEAIRKKGYDGASSTIRMFTTRERKLMKEAKNGQSTPVEKIERKWLISLLYKPVDKVNGISEQHLNKVIEIYPELGRIYDVVAGFKQVLFSRKTSELDKWMEEARNLEIDEITSFVNGTSQDQVAVKKAVELEYNNGLAEGSVNKLKTIKRIMYGRSKFAMLKSKILWRNLYR